MKNVANNSINYVRTEPTLEIAVVNIGTEVGIGGPIMTHSIAKIIQFPQTLK